MRDLTKEEQEVIKLTADLINKIHALPEIHTALAPECVRSIHDIQARIMARPFIEFNKSKDANN